MFKWALFLLVLAAVTGCLTGMGVGTNALAKLLLALVAMICIALLIARPFLKSERP
jgi:hypothetical protein